MGGAIIHHISETMMKPELQHTQLLVLSTSRSWIITSTQEWVWGCVDRSVFARRETGDLITDSCDCDKR